MDFTTFAIGLGLFVFNAAAVVLVAWIGGRVAYRFDHILPGAVAGALVYAVLAAGQIWALGPDNFRCAPPGKYAYCSGADDEWRVR